jgi:hypothetical protein
VVRRSANLPDNGAAEVEVVSLFPADVVRSPAAFHFDSEAAHRVSSCHALVPPS